MRNYRYYPKINELAAGIVAALSLIGNAAAVNTQIQTDGTLSGIAELNINAPGSGQLYTLSEIHGKLSGHNLFYSFSNFSIGTTDSAWFNLNTPDLANVISRVTGGSESLIDGKLQMTNVGSTPSFFFINPAGITFSSGASVDVPGSFYVSTASGLNFSDGSQLAVNETSTSALSSANPESFGFLGNESGSINIGDVETNSTNLAFKSGTDIALVGNQIHVENTVIKNADFSQPALNMQLIATGDNAANINLNMLPNPSAFDGDLSLENAILEATGNGLGSIVARAGHFKAVNSNLSVGSSEGALVAGENSIDVQASLLTLDNSKLFTVASSTGDAGNITVKTESLKLLNSSWIVSSIDSNNSLGKSGEIMISTNDLSIDNKSLIASANAGEEMAGNVIVYADSVKMDNSSLIYSQSTNQSGLVEIKANDLTVNNSFIFSDITVDGISGDVKVSVDTLHLNNGRINTGGMSSGSKTDSGAVVINAKELIINDGIIDSAVVDGRAGDVIVSTDYLAINRSIDVDRGIFSRAISNGRGDSGNIVVNSKELTINKGYISSSISSDGARIGEISITTDVLKMTGGSIGADTATSARGGFVSIYADQVVIDSGGIISSTTLGNGSAGNIALTAKSLEINNGLIATMTGGNGNAGDIIIAAQSLKLSKDGRIASSSASAVGGQGGDITIDSQQITLDGTLLSNTIGSGDAGNIVVNADTLNIHGHIFTTTTGTAQGKGGDIAINAQRIDIEGEIGIDGTKIIKGIFANTDSGNAGNITVNAEYVSLSNAGSIQATANENAEGHGGNISINVKELELNDGFINGRTLGKGNAGNVMIATQALRLSDNSRIIAGSGSTASGDGGFISIDADEIAISNSFVVNETYGSGNSGEINMTSDSVRLHENGFISASTFGSGHAGDINMTTNSLTAYGTGNLVVDLFSSNLTGVFSGAGPNSSGQIGSIEINAIDAIQLNNAAQISIKNDATVTEDKLSSLTPTAINIDTASLFLTNSRIAADSNGNVDAGNINIHFDKQLFLDPSQISTEAASGNGGDITIAGEGAVFLLDSAITTSVSGQSGNGGDIAIAGSGLILDSGFIQANTAASGASGGNVDIKTPALIPSGNSLFVGGNTPFQFQPFSGLNVIQAAAPDGVGGTISTSTPQLNLNAMLTNLVVESFDSNVLNRDMCAVSESSSLMQSGRGAQPLRARDLLLSPLF